MSFIYTDHKLGMVIMASSQHVSGTVDFLNVTSDGRTGRELISSLKNQCISINSYTKDVLTQSEFDREHVTNGVEYNSVVIRGSELNVHTNKNIRQVGTIEHGFCEPNAEVAALLAENISVKDFKRLEKQHDIHYLVVMHKPIKDSRSVPLLLCFYGYGGKLRLRAHWGGPDHCWDAAHDFVFIHM